MNKQWTARWIKSTRFQGLTPYSMLHKELNPVKLEHSAEFRNRHTLFRKTFDLDRLPQQADLALTADDYYKLCKRSLRRTGTAQGYPFHYFYNQVDILPHLRKGKNVLAVHVYYQGLVNRVFKQRRLAARDDRRASYGRRCSDRNGCILANDRDRAVWTRRHHRL